MPDNKCPNCGRYRPLEEFISKCRNRVTKQCAKCRKSRRARQNTVNHKKLVAKKVRVIMCPFERGDVVQKPFGGMM